MCFMRDLTQAYTAVMGNACHLEPAATGITLGHTKEKGLPASLVEKNLAPMVFGVQGRILALKFHRPMRTRSFEHAALHQVFNNFGLSNTGTKPTINYGKDRKSVSYPK